MAAAAATVEGEKKEDLRILVMESAIDAIVRQTIEDVEGLEREGEGASEGWVIGTTRSEEVDEEGDDGVKMCGGSGADMSAEPPSRITSKKG